MINFSGMAYYIHWNSKDASALKCKLIVIIIKLRKTLNYAGGACERLLMTLISIILNFTR